MILRRPDDHFVTQSSGTNFLLPVLLPVDSIPGSLRFFRGFRQAHNLKVAGSNPAPATNTNENTHTAILVDGGFFMCDFISSQRQYHAPLIFAVAIISRIS